MVPRSLPQSVFPVGASVGAAMSSPATYPVLSPHSPYARSIADLSSIVLWMMLGIFVVVSLLVTYCIHKFRAKPGQPVPAPIYGNTKLEVGYTFSFFVILAAILVFAIRSMSASDPEGSQPATMLVVAHQWWWEIRYPGTNIVTANEIHIPVGDAEHLAVKSADVIHDFWVPELGRKIDIIPGVENHIWLSADTPGTYLGSCAEYCGVEHAWMRIRVIAQSPAQFVQWEQDQSAPAAMPVASPAAEGAEYFQQLTCASCHTIRGTSAAARIGPDLTHVASRETLASGRLANTSENLAEWLHEPDTIKPGCKMPNLHLTRQQQDSLVAYLETLR